MPYRLIIVTDYPFPPYTLIPSFGMNLFLTALTISLN